MVSNLPSLCPHTCSRPPVVPHVPSPRRVEIAFLAGFMVLFFHWRRRAMSHGGSAARMRYAALDGPEGRDARDAAGVVRMILTSGDGRIASSEYFLIKVDARSVAGLTVSVAGDE